MLNSIVFKGPDSRVPSPSPESGDSQSLESKAYSIPGDIADLFA